MTSKRLATTGNPEPSAAPGSLLQSWGLGEKQRFCLALVTPAAIILLLFQIVPIVIGANSSFRNWMLHAPTGEWIGLGHYIYVITDPVFLKIVLPNTFLFMLLTVTISLAAGLALAHLLNRSFLGRSVVQTVILLPLMIAPVVASMMFRWMFNDQFGIVSVVMGALGMGSFSWLAERWPSFAIIVLADVWLWTPWFTIILLAALRSLPKEPFEAAQIDAASTWRVFTHITLPMLRPVMAICIVVRSIDAFRTFDQFWVISGGGPARETEVFSIYAYTEAFLKMNFGRGTAAALIGAVIVGIFSWFLYRMLYRFLEVSR